MTSGGLSFVAMVEAADFGERDHVTVGDRVYGSRDRRIFGQREMSPRTVIIGNVSGERPPEMRLVEDDHVIETLAANGSDQPFNVWALPRAHRTGDHFRDPHARSVSPLNDPKVRWNPRPCEPESAYPRGRAPDV